MCVISVVERQLVEVPQFTRQRDPIYNRVLLYNNPLYSMALLLPEEASEVQTIHMVD